MAILTNMTGHNFSRSSFLKSISLHAILQQTRTSRLLSPTKKPAL